METRGERPHIQEWIRSQEVEEAAERDPLERTEAQGPLEWDEKA